MAQGSSGPGTVRAGDDGTRPGGGARQGMKIVAAFLTGALLAAAAALVLVTLGVLGGDDAVAEPAPSASGGTSEAAPGDPAGDVPASCVQAAEYNETLTTALDDIALGVRDQDARRMQEALDAVQDAQPGSEEASRECREAAGEDTTDEQDEEPADGDEDTGATDDEGSGGSSSPEPTTTATP